MAKGDALKKFKAEQKEKTRQLLQKIIQDLQAAGEKVSVSKVATLARLSRANIYANYKDLFDKPALIEDKAYYKEFREILKDKESTLHTLRQENSSLKEANLKLMDELVAMKILLENCNKLT